MTWIIYALLFALEYAQYIMFLGLIFNGIVWIIIIICNVYVWRVIFGTILDGTEAAGQRFFYFLPDRHTHTHTPHNSIHGIHRICFMEVRILWMFYSIYFIYEKRNIFFVRRRQQQAAFVAMAAITDMLVVHRIHTYP